MINSITHPIKLLKKINPTECLLALAYACLFILKNGYIFNSVDHDEHLPPVYKLLNPALYGYDFYVNEYFSAFNIRHYFVQTFYFLGKIFPLEPAFFVIEMLCLFFMALIWMNIAKHFTANKWAIIATPILVFFIFYNFTIGGNNLTYNYITCGTIAKVFASAGVLWFLKRNFWLSGLLFGAGALYQILSASQPFLILFLLMLIYRNLYRWKEVVYFSIGYGMVAVFTVAPLFYAYFYTPHAVSSQDYAQIMYYFRTPWHHIPSRFPISHYLKYGVLVAAGVWASFRFLSSEKRNFLILFTAIQTLGAVFYWISVEKLNGYAVAQSQWFKSTIWVSAFSAMVCGIAFFESTKRYTARLPLNPLVMSCAVLSIVLLTAIMIFNVPYTAKLRQRIAFGLPKTDLQIMHDWIALNTPLNATFLIPPNNTSFSCEAKRSLLVSVHAQVHTPTSTLKWYKNYSKTYGVTTENVGNKPFREVALLNYQTQIMPTEAEYRLDKVDDCKFLDQLPPAVHQAGEWRLTKLK